MKIIKNETKDNTLILDVQADNTLWTKAVQKEIDKASKNVKISGFRPGKAPKNELKKHLNMPHILFIAANSVANEVLKELIDSKEIIESKLDIYPTPALDIVKIDENELTLKYTFYAFPTADVGDYKKMKIDIIKPNVTDQEVEQELNRILSKEKMYQKKDGPITNGDLAVFDFKGFINNEQFPGGTAEKYELEIGTNTFIPGFEEKMVGLKVGDEKDLNLSFPKDYHARDFAGKDVVFKVKIHDVKTIIKPKMDDNFVKNLKIKDVQTVQQLKDYIKTNMFRFKTQDANEKNVMTVNQGLVKITKTSTIPQIIIDDEIKKIKKQLEQRLQQMQMKLEDYAKLTGKSLADFDKEIAEQAKNNVIVYSALEVIAKKEKIKVKEEDINKKFEELATNYHMPIEEVKKSLDKDLLSELLLNELTIQKIISYYL